MMKGHSRASSLLLEQTHQSVEEVGEISRPDQMNEGSRNNQPTTKRHGQRNRFAEPEMSNENPPQRLKNGDEACFQWINVSMREVRQNDREECTDQRNIQNNGDILREHGMEVLPIAEEQRKEDHPERKAKVFNTYNSPKLLPLLLSILIHKEQVHRKEECSQQSDDISSQLQATQRRSENEKNTEQGQQTGCPDRLSQGTPKDGRRDNSGKNGPSRGEKRRRGRIGKFFRNGNGQRGNTEA